ncbi:MAG: hypothetical protein JSW08_03755 [archaeon]|nr:MAG: hypothetical protein JSW08_03755 [archaeon]
MEETTQNIKIEEPRTEEIQEKPVEIKKEEPKKVIVESKPQKKGAIKPKWPLIILIILLAIIALAFFIRISNVSGLKDVTTGNYTLGPDLDPFWYTRIAEEISTHGSPLNPDMMRAAPLGVEASYNLHSYLIAGFHKITSIFSPNIQFKLSAILFPAVFFCLAIVFFFLFSRRVFAKFLDKTKTNIAALVSTAFFAIIPDMLHRTIAGIPEHESSGIFFLFLALYFFVLGWDSKGKKAMIFSVIAGIATGLMMSSWAGGSKYIFMIVGLAMLIAFLFGKIRKKEFMVYIMWFILSLITIAAIDPAFSLNAALKSMSDVGFCFIILILMIIDKILFETKIKEKLKNIKLPRSIVSIIISVIVAFIVALIINPSLIGSLFSEITSRLVHPFGTGRIGLTVAENRAPYLVELLASFSKTVFWLFFIGVILLFYSAIQHFKNKKLRTGLLITFFIFLVFLLFSRHSPGSVFNGENGFSKFLYFAGPIIFIVYLLYAYIKSYIEGSDDFKNIKFGYLLLISAIFWTIISIRGGIRLFFIISPFMILAFSFLPIKLFTFAKSKDELRKIVVWCLVIVIAILLIITFINYEQRTANSAKFTIPGAYNQQWQRAMSWVRENTTEDSIFAHWWDYGYWVQSIGERPTILDGGHAGHGGFWNYLMARYVLTTPEEKDALEFLYAHNTSYLLIDSTDIGKASAYSSIGSDETGWDRYTWIGTFVMDPKQTQETRDEKKYAYLGGTLLDADFKYMGQIFPKQKAGIPAFIMTTDQDNNIKMVEAVLIYNEQQYMIPVRYVYINNDLFDLTGNKTNVFEGCFYIVPSVDQQGLNNFGASMYLSEKTMNALWAKLYLFNDSENFELGYKEPAPVVAELKANYNLDVGDLIFAGGQMNGPIKIWKVDYPSNFEVPEETIKRYLSRESDLPFPLW